MTELLREMEEYAENNRVPIITKSARDAFLREAKKAKPKNALEIGTAIGYSTLLIASAGAEKIVTLELDEERAKLARKFIVRSPHGDKTEIITGDAKKSLEDLKNRLDEGKGCYFDFVFIDAAKGQYPAYWEAIQPLLAKNATVLADNVLFRGYVTGEEKAPRRFKTIVARLKEYLTLTKNAEGFTTEIISDGDGLSVSRRVIK